MIVRSTRPDNHFTILRNEVLRDTRLSFRARGLLVSILSRPDNWSVRSEQLATETTEGRSAILTALKELREYGYIKIEKRRLENGRFETVQTVYDLPQCEEAQVTPSVDRPDSVKPKLVQPDQVKNNSLEERKRRNVEEEETISPSSDDDVESKFQRFWSIYPKRKDIGKARAAFKRALKKSSVETICAGAERYAQFRLGKDPQYTKHATTWLNAMSWMDEPDPDFQRPLSKREEADELFASAHERLSQRRMELGI